MGIKGLGPFIAKKEDLDIYISASIKDLAGNRVGVDALNWICMNMPSANKYVLDRIDNVILEPDRNEIILALRRLLVYFVASWCKAGVVPVFIMDGKAPVEKMATQAGRRQTREKQKTDLEELIDMVKDLDPFDVPADIKEKIKNRRKQDIGLKTEEIKDFVSFLDGMGIPYIQANGEAEALGSMLTIEHITAGLYTTDTDAFVYGARVVINKFQGHDKEQNPLYRMAKSEDVYEGLGMTQKQLIEFAIMCGCDYNNNMPGIGPAKSFKLLKEHGTIDDLPDKYDTACLKHKICREMFKYQPSKGLISHGYMDFDMNKARKAVTIGVSYGLEDCREQLRLIASNIPVVTKNYIYNPITKQLIELS